MRILFTTTPGWGHVHPMVPLARALVDQGHRVEWATAAEVAPRLEREGFTVHPAGPGFAETLGEFRRRFPEVEALPPTDRPDFMFPRIFGVVRTGPTLGDLLPAARAFRPDLLVSDQAEFAGPIAAAALGVPGITHSFGGLLPGHRVEAAGQAVAHLWEEQGLEPRPYAGSYDHLYLDIYPARLRAADAGHVESVQPLRPVAFATGEEVTLPDWITAASATPLVYVTFGTVFNENPELISTVVTALRDLPIRVVVTVGPKGDPGRLGVQPANVHVAGYIPQTQLLRYCTAVVSHAGSGTLLASLARGLPQLCLPQAADQFGNAAACVGAGAGLALLPGSVTVEGVGAGIERLLADDAFRSAAAGISEEIGGMPGPDEVARIITTRFGAAS